MSNSIIRNNQYGIISPERSTYYNCTIDSNSIVGIQTSQKDSIIECEIKYNGIGLVDSTSGGSTPSYITKNIIENNNLGIRLSTESDEIFCNRICNNTTYDLKSNIIYNTNCVANNYWCTPDSVSTQAVIYDGYDNISLGLVYFMPIDTSLCYLLTGIPDNELTDNSFVIFPNPFSTQTTLQTNNYFDNATLTIGNYLGETIQEIKNISGQTFTLERDNLPIGIYFIRLVQDNKILGTKRMVITDWSEIEKSTSTNSNFIKLPITY